MKTKIDDPDYWQQYGIVIPSSIFRNHPTGARVENETLYNLRVMAYPEILDEHGKLIGRVE
jgi:hypothetical protein